MSTNLIIKKMSCYGNNIDIGDTSNEYELIWSHLTTNRIMSPSASESSLLCTYMVHNCLIIAENDRTLNLTKNDWSQIYGFLQLSCFVIYWTESIPHHSECKNHTSHSPKAKKVLLKKGLIGICQFGPQHSNLPSISDRPISNMTVHISRCHDVPMMSIPHLPWTERLDDQRLVACSVTRNKVSGQSGITFHIRDYTTHTDVKMMQMLFALGMIAVAGLLIWR